MTNEEVAALLSPDQISQAAIEITKIIVLKNNSPMTYAESCRLMVLMAAPHVQFPLLPFTAVEFDAAENKMQDFIANGPVQDFVHHLVEGRKQPLDSRSVKLNAMVAEIEAMAASGKKFEPIVAAELLLGALEGLEEIAEL